MEPRERIISVGRNARKLAQTPLPPELGENLQLRDAIGDSTLREYQQLSETVSDLGDGISKLTDLEAAYKTLLEAKNKNLQSLNTEELASMAERIRRTQEKIGNDVELDASVEDIRDTVNHFFGESEERMNAVKDAVLTERQTISEMVRENPELIEIQQLHAQHFLANDMRDQILETTRRIDPSQLADILNDLLPEDQRGGRISKFLGNRAVDQMSEDEIREQIINLNLERQQQGFMEEFSNYGRARAQQSEMLRMPKERWDETLLKYAESDESILTQQDIDPYMGGVNREDFLERHGPIMASEYVTSRMRPPQEDSEDPLDDTTSPGEGNRGIDPDHFGGSDPLHVIVDDILDSTILPVHVTSVADGVGMGAGAGTGGGTGATGEGDAEQKTSTNQDDALMRGFGIQQLLGVGNTFSDMATPGGPSMANFAGNVLGGAAQAGGFFGRIGMGPLAAAGIASLAYNTGMNLAEHQRGLERTFGEETPIFGGDAGDVMGEQVQVRFQQIMLTSEEINGLTDTLAGL